MSIIKSLLGKNRELKYEMLFGTACSDKGDHGALIGTWVREGSRNPITIPFYFVGFIHAPKMTPELMTEIWYHAQMVGIHPSHIGAYQDIARPRQARAVALAPSRVHELA